MIQVDAKFLYYRLAKREAEVDTRLKKASDVRAEEIKAFDAKVEAYKKLSWFRKLFTQNPLSLGSSELRDHLKTDALHILKECRNWYSDYLPLRTICEHAILTGQKIDLPLRFAHILSWPAE